MFELKTKNGKSFYGCEGYPECDFKSWDIPANEKCPECGTEMIVKNYKTKRVISCPSPKCKYFRSEQIENKENDEQN